MTSDIVERLQRLACACPTVEQAIDEIERLRAVLARIELLAKNRANYDVEIAELAREAMK